MTEHHRETAFLRRVIHYDDTAERHELDERITQAQRDERCVQRAVQVMVLLSALAMAGLCYSAIFLANHPQNLEQFITPIVIKVFCALGLASLICLVAFVVLRVTYRRALDQRREECRRLAAKMLESRLGKPRARPLPEGVKEQDGVV